VAAVVVAVDLDITVVVLSCLIIFKAQVFASTYDAFISDIMPIRDTLPVISTEFGQIFPFLTRDPR
jgi:hypothetical protein